MARYKVINGQNWYPESKYMYTYSFKIYDKPNGWLMKNYGLRMYSDKICEDSANNLFGRSAQIGPNNWDIIEKIPHLAAVVHELDNLTF